MNSSSPSDRQVWQITIYDATGRVKSRPRSVGTKEEAETRAREIVGEDETFEVHLATNQIG